MFVVDILEVHTSNFPLKEETIAVQSGGGMGGLGAAGKAISTTGYETNTYGEGGGKYFEKDFNGSILGTLPLSYKEGGNFNMAYVENYFADVSKKIYIVLLLGNHVCSNLENYKQYSDLIVSNLYFCT